MPDEYGAGRLRRLALATCLAVITARGAPAQAADTSADAVVRVVADSSVITVTRGAGASVQVNMPAGSFSVRADSATLARWADEATAARAVAVLRGRPAMNAMSLAASTRAGDAPGSYRLAASNGAWSGVITLAPSAAHALFEALRGGGTPNAEPLADAPLLEFQVDEQPQVVPGGEVVPEFPRALWRAGISGRVLLEYVVDVDGGVRPSSVRLIEATAPAFAAAAHDAVLRRRLSPARRGGVPVPMVIQQPFIFRTQ